MHSHKKIVKIKIIIILINVHNKNQSSNNIVLSVNLFIVSFGSKLAKKVSCAREKKYSNESSHFTMNQCHIKSQCKKLICRSTDQILNPAHPPTPSA